MSRVTEHIHIVALLCTCHAGCDVETHADVDKHFTRPHVHDDGEIHYDDAPAEGSPWRRSAE